MIPIDVINQWKRKIRLYFFAALFIIVGATIFQAYLSITSGDSWHNTALPALFNLSMIMSGVVIGSLVSLELQLAVEKERNKGTRGGQSYSFKASGTDWSFEASCTGGKLCTKDGPAPKCHTNNDGAGGGESGSGRQGGSGNS